MKLIVDGGSCRRDLSEVIILRLAYPSTPSQSAQNIEAHVVTPDGPIGWRPPGCVVPSGLAPDVIEQLTGAVPPSLIETACPRSELVDQCLDARAQQEHKTDIGADNRGGDREVEQ